jgi:TolB-like protein/Tfp pilus assembly protein PilF
MSESSHAVFLSYASQDAEAAKRMAEALRGAGVEVWFDQNELVGGDAWDAKIRGQISSCALFLPVISANTQARLEGYFRLEWKLAAQRTHTMADEKAFLLPIVIDGTRDAEAKVPAEFRAVQWTKLPGGETSPAFAARVKKLLAGDADGVGGILHPDSSEQSGDKIPPTHARHSARRWWWALPIFGVMMALLLVLKEPRGIAPTPAQPGKASGSRPEVAQILDRVRAATGKIDVLHTELDTMEGLLEQATKLDPADAAIWAQWAMLDCLYMDKYYERSPARRDAARRHVAQAAGLDPQAPAVRLAQAVVIAHLANNDAAAKAEATKLLEPLLTETPADGNVPLELGWQAFDPAHPEAALSWFDRAAQIPGFSGRAHFARGRVLVYSQRTNEAVPEFDRALEAGRSSEVLLWKAYLLACWYGDPAAARRALDLVPPQFFVEDMPAATRYYVSLLLRDYDQALVAVRAVPHDYLQSIAYSGPAGYFAGNALNLAGKTTAAELEWRSALATVERRLAAEPNNRTLMEFKALLQAALGDRDAGRKTWRAVRELYGDGAVGNFAPSLYIELESTSEVFLWLENTALTNTNLVTAAQLKLDPVFDPIRADPRFPALLEKAEADPRFSPKASIKTAASDEKSVAVLAFDNLSEDKANEYFSDGISEELLNVLAKVAGLKVTARTSSFHFKGSNTAIPDIAKQLGVAYVVEGSVRKAGDKVRITAQLIKAADGFHVWSETFTRDLKDIFAVQDEIAGLIAKTLELKIGREPSAHREVNPEAFRLLLSGRAKVRQSGNANRDSGIADFRAAVELAPDYAEAWAQMAHAYIQNARFGGVALETGFREARRAAQKALALAPDSAEVLANVAWVRRTADWDWRAADQMFHRAVQLSPENADILTEASVTLLNVGHVEEAIALGRRAVVLDPLNPDAHFNLSFIQGNAGHLPEAMESAGRAVALAPDAEDYRSNLAGTLADIGRLDEAERELALEPHGDVRISTGALILIRRGQKDAARAKIRELEGLPNRNNDMAEMYAENGDTDLAFAALERSYALHETGMAWTKVDYYLKNLRSDPRWPAFLRKMGLADEQLK